MRKMTAVAAMCGATALAITARATDYITLVTPNLEWTNASSWSDNRAAHSGADYLVALGDDSNLNLYALRTTGKIGSNTVETFPGDSLTIGIVGGTKGDLHGKIYNEAHTKYKLLVLANGRYNSTVPTPFSLDGAISVTSPASDPFLLQTHGSIIRVAASISGEAGVQFNVDQSPNGHKAVLILSGDNSSYFGKMGVGASDCGILFNSANSVGGALETTTPDAYILPNGAKFGTGASLPAGSTLSRANAGITAVSGTVKLLVENDVTFQIPITGSAAVNKTDDSNLSITGAGVVTWDADWTAGTLTVWKGGYFFSAPDFFVKHYADVFTKIGKRCTKFLLGNVNGVRRSADGTGVNLSLACIQSHVFGNAVKRIKTSDRTDVQSSVRIDFSDHKSYVIQMRCNAKSIAFSPKSGNYSAFTGNLVIDLEFIEHFAHQ